MGWAAKAPCASLHSVITLYSYPALFGVADNNGYGLKVFAFLRLAKLDFVHAHIFDASAAPRGQLPYITDGGQAIGDSDAILAHLTRAYRLDLDAGLGSGNAVWTRSSSVCSTIFIG